ncbi:MAG: exodeoxyribonuclease VII large subunit, partial [Pseudohongiellaceae bacterium]
LLIEGEISNLSMPASGHWYLTLKDEQAQLRCAMFRNRNMRLPFRPRNGMQVLIRGRLSLYEGRGDYQLIADGMEEAGDGALRRAFEQLKAKLAAEGLFDPAHKQPIADHYHHIGIITSATGAAIHDMLTVFRRRFPATQITLFPVAVQGAEAAANITHALQLANRLADKLGIEALILGRGGGSLEDLQAFNDESVARAIFASRLPVVSAVGHEVDFTIADFVADLRAATPSAAAELMSPDQLEFLQQFADFRRQLTNAIARQFQDGSRRLDSLRGRLKHPGRRLQEHAQTLDRLEAGLRRAVKQNLARQNTQLTHLARSLNTVSPLQTLGRGYSITYNENHEVLRNSIAVNPGDKVTTRLHQGSLIAQVLKIEE